MKKVSVLYLTIDRYPSCVENLRANMTKCGLAWRDIEFLWADNGSADKNVRPEMERAIQDLFDGQSFSRMSKENEGVARTLNQLILRSTAPYIVQLGNDYSMPENWLRSLVDYAEAVPKTGIAAIAWCADHRRPLQQVPGTEISVHLADYDHPVFGVKLKTRAMFDEIGAYDEKLHPYGLEDTDLHRRSELAGFRNYYLPNLLSQHLGSDSGEKSDYRRMKDQALKNNGPYLVTKNYKRFGYYEPWPPHKGAFQ